MPDKPTSEPDGLAPGTPRDKGAGSEKYKERGVILRVFVYVIAGHVFAGFLWLLFYVGAHSHK
ncbi:DUF6126 family protein [Actinacidiphila rubida]|uniref:Small hydrophobic protein n=1 Tax=Actinacidiphila rubida TaxID=310780 RepID=A0A1H8SKJ6_9ACTN|nr:DUF6126 family protein [Actinacidiphila rubida]SEO79320.1 hypothetical protein SAMN05216267_104344 [Actinacidiphila rubida]